MLSTSIFKKSLPTSISSASCILKKLKDLLGCTYLHNNGHSIIGFLPLSYCIYQAEQLHIYNRNSKLDYILDTFSLSKNIHQFIEFKKINKSNIEKLNNSSDFFGGYMGFIDYNFAAQQFINSTLNQQPNVFIGHYETFLKYENEQWFFYSHEDNAPHLYELIFALFNDESLKSKPFELKQKCTAQWTQQQYSTAFQQIQDYIKAGDCYQINLTQEFKANASGLLLDTAEQFWNLTDAPYSGYLKINDFELLSCSPELFIDFEENRKIITKPIKGTMPRFDDPILDQQSKNTLIHSLKDQAENVMIVDLLRNDLSMYAEIGSVQTPKLFNIESFNQVHHMVSEVTAILKPEVNPFDVLMSALPGGSITGAPKIRAMQIIEELEHAPRGAYCGSMGYFNFDGTGSWNILIRSVQKHQNEVSLSAGGGITIASDCDAEYQECFDKISAMLNLLNTWYQPE